jgi:hypothetical protein
MSLVPYLVQGVPRNDSIGFPCPYREAKMEFPGPSLRLDHCIPPLLVP